MQTMWTTILFNFLVQVVGILVVLFGFTLLLSLISKTYIEHTGKVGYTLNKITGFIGTPIHELSHALLCLVFFHRIEEIKLYTFQDGVLGYVNHSYNRKNPYKVMGNFFIGVAPIFGGTAFILLVMWLLTPSVFQGVLSAVGGLNFDFLSQTFIGDLFVTIKNVIFAFLSIGDTAFWKYLIMLIVTICVSSHMLLSTADIKGGIGGFIILLLLLLISNYVAFQSGTPSAVTNWLLTGLVMIVPFLCLALFLDCIKFVIMLLYRIFGGR